MNVTVAVALFLHHDWGRIWVLNVAACSGCPTIGKVFNCFHTFSFKKKQSNRRSDLMSLHFDFENISQQLSGNLSIITCINLLYLVFVCTCLQKTQSKTLLNSCTYIKKEEKR